MDTNTLFVFMGTKLKDSINLGMKPAFIVIIYLQVFTRNK